ncbi:MAG: Na+ dependent nucleoside transporter N-terminal domain-containing protein, partial [Vulcanimicrobiota bacterium]
MYYLRGLLGIFLLLAIAFALSFKKKKISWPLVGKGILLQVVFALLVLKTQAGKIFFSKVNDVILGVLNFSDTGASFIFGNLVNDTSIGAIFAFKVLPTII